MAKFVCILLVLAVAISYAASTGLDGAAAAGRGRDNPKTEDCPHGRRYLSKCNWCSCVPGHTSSCTLTACEEWTCEKSLALHSLSDLDCVGHCSCNSTTLITTCEKRGC